MNLQQKHPAAEPGQGHALPVLCTYSKGISLRLIPEEERQNKKRVGLELVGRVGLGVEAGESRGKNGEQNNVGADICPEMQVECGGREQVIWKMRHTHTQKLGPESRVKANMGKERLIKWGERKLLVEADHM